MLVADALFVAGLSLPTRGGWIEMGKYIKSDPLGLVPPLKLLY